MIISMRYSYSLSFFLTNFFGCRFLWVPIGCQTFIFSLYNVHGYKPVKQSQYRYQGYATTAAVVMDQRLGVIKGEMTSSYEITLETFKVPSPHVAVFTPSLLVTLRSPCAYSFQGVNYLPRLIWRYSTR